jgi:hypothetical protein
LAALTGAIALLGLIIADHVLIVMLLGRRVLISAHLSL